MYVVVVTWLAAVSLYQDQPRHSTCHHHSGLWHHTVTCYILVCYYGVIFGALSRPRQDTPHAITTQVSDTILSRDVKVVFFLKIDYRLLKIDFFSIIVSLVASLEGGGRGGGPPRAGDTLQVWCGRRGGWWRGRPAKTQTEQTRSTRR